MELKEVFDDIILGRGVKRSVHELVFENRDRTDLFLERLLVHGFKPRPLKDVDVPPGIRIPGFWLDDNKRAWFGYLFREFFTEKKQRKIWGSTVRNSKGDWSVILSGNSAQIVYLNPALSREIDIYRLTGI